MSVVNPQIHVCSHKFYLEVITGSLSDECNDIGMPHRRDPDALPPRGTLDAIGCAVFSAFNALGHGNAIFAFKGGVVAGTWPSALATPERIENNLA